jgi:isopropylmalate/homocitrate/citramalate synthase
MGGVNLEILDCTLRDGNHAISGGFKPEMAAHIIGGLLDAGVEVIEFGRASGIGSKAGNITDEKYLAAATPYLGRGEIGMFYRPELFGDCQYQLASESKLAFLRVGTHAGSVENSAKTLSSIRKMGIKARYSLIQAHMLSPAEIAESGRKVESYGAQSINFKIGLHSEPKDTWNNFWHAVVFSAMFS